MSERGRASFSNLGGNTRGNFHRVVSSSDSNLGGSMGGNLQRGRTYLPNLGNADPQTDFVVVFSQVTPHGLQMIGGRAEEGADNYYTQYILFTVLGHTDEWKKKSLIGKRNRSTSVDSRVTDTYTGGNIEVSETRKQMVSNHNYKFY